MDHNAGVATEDLTFRSVSEMGGATPAVVATFYDISRAHERSVRPDLDDLTHEQVRAELGNPITDLDASGIWFSADGPVMVAYISIDRQARTLEIDAYAMPDRPATDFELAIDRGLGLARELKAADNNALKPYEVDDDDLYEPHKGLWQLQMFCRDEDQRYRRIVEAAQLRHVRNFYRMTIDVRNWTESVTDYPGLVLIPATNEETQRQLQRVMADSFRHHWGSNVDRSFEDWKAMRSSAPNFRWDRCHLVQLDGVNVAGLMRSDQYLEDDMDYIATLGVLEEFRGRGIASWLLRRSFDDAHKAGVHTVGLNVDADNTTGAVGLYEAVGMRSTETYVAYRAPVR